jgi:hypothetical protein
VSIAHPRRMRRHAVAMPLAAAAAAALVLVAAPSAQADEQAAASVKKERLAKRLMRLDPGARLGGNTQVATVPRTRLFGVSDRVNFMLGLAPRQRIVGGAGADQLGMRRAAGRVHGGPGNDLIHGGPGDDVLKGGPGNDLIYGGGGDDRLKGGPGNNRLIDGKGATEVRAAGRTRVEVADGRGDDRVLCAPGASGRIEVDPGDWVAPGCRDGSSRVVVRQVSAATSQAPATDAGVAQQPVAGKGTNSDPFIAACDSEGSVDCTVSSFPARTLGGFWSNESVPAYKCPSDHEYLLNANYAPIGTALVPGVEVRGLGPVGVSITTPSVVSIGGGFFEATGTATGGGASSATNWNGTGAQYRVILHCTSDSSRGYTYNEGPPT